MNVYQPVLLQGGNAINDGNINHKKVSIER